jgi:hypothetical protein
MVPRPAETPAVLPVLDFAMAGFILRRCIAEPTSVDMAKERPATRLAPKCRTHCENGSFGVYRRTCFQGNLQTRNIS